MVENKNSVLDYSNLEKYLAVDVNSAEKTESNMLEGLTGDKKLYVICGAGGLGKKIHSGLQFLKIEVVAFADANPKLWGTLVQGIKVLSPEEAASKYQKNATFIMAIWGAYSKDRIVDRKREWVKRGCNTISFVSVFWKFPKIFLPHYSIGLPSSVFKSKNEILKAYSFFKDEESCKEFVHQIYWRSELDYEKLPEPSRDDIYFPQDLIVVDENEVFIDCGAYTGDSLANFLTVSGGKFKNYVGLEPDRINFNLLQKFADGLSENIQRKIRLSQSAIGFQNGQVTMMPSGLPSSSMASGFGSEVVNVFDLETICEGQAPTYIKMDIEGYEMEALKGGINYISKIRPKLAIATYHLPQHLWELTNFLGERLINYRFYLRPHDLEGWDVVLYAIPKENQSNV